MESAHASSQESLLCASFPCSTSMVAGNLPQWEYLPHGNRQTRKIRASPWTPQLQNIYYITVPFIKKSNQDEVPARQVLLPNQRQQAYKHFKKKKLHEKMFDLISHKGNSHQKREIQIKNTTKCQFTPTRMARINKRDDNKCCKENVEKPKPSESWWECKMSQPLWKAV